MINIGEISDIFFYSLTHHCLLLVSFQFFNFSHHLPPINCFNICPREKNPAITSAKSLLTSWRLSINLRISWVRYFRGQFFLSISYKKSSINFYKPNFCLHSPCIHVKYVTKFYMKMKWILSMYSMWIVTNMCFNHFDLLLLWVMSSNSPLHEIQWNQ